MHLDKAIELLRPLDQDSEIILDPDTYDAIQLGIEALKWRQVVEHQDRNLHLPPLPSETSPVTPPQSLGYDPDL